MQLAIEGGGALGVPVALALFLLLTELVRSSRYKTRRWPRPSL